MSQFIESIRVEDRKLHLPDLHQQRVIRTFEHFAKENSIDISKIYQDLQHDGEGLFKLRIVYDFEKVLQTQLIPYAISELHSVRLVENNLYDYAFKFSDRTILENMRREAKSDEIIIVKNNRITDTSFSNLLFKKGKTWYTPSTFLLNGVQRQHLLKTKKIKETEITVQNLREFSHFQIINAMNDFDDMFIYPLSIIQNLP